MQVVVNIPDQYFLDTTTVDVAGRLKLYSALLMFQTGQLSAGAACEFAGIDRYSFMAACKRHHINVIAYDEDELDVDFKNLKESKTEC